MLRPKEVNGGLTTNSPQAAGILGGQEQGHLPKAGTGLRTGARADRVHRDDGVRSLALVLAASAERAVPGLPQGPRHPRAVRAGCSGGMGDSEDSGGWGDPDCPKLEPPWDKDHPKADLEGYRWASDMGSRRVKETLGEASSGGSHGGGEEPTALLLRDAERRVAAVQDGALRADAALAQHLALLWVQRAQHPILTRLGRLAGCHTGLVCGIAGAQEGCRAVGTRQGEERAQGTICDSADSAKGFRCLSPLDQESANAVLLKHSHVQSFTCRIWLLV